MASFYGKDSEEAAAHFEAEFFAGDDLFQLNVEPIGRVNRRRFSPDPLMGFDPTSMEPSEPRPPMLQPPILTSTGGKIPLTCGRSRLHGPDPKYDILKESYKAQLVREDSAIEELPEQEEQGVWGRLGRSSSPNVVGFACADLCGIVCNGSCQERPYGTRDGEVRSVKGIYDVRREYIEIYLVQILRFDVGNSSQVDSERFKSCVVNMNT